MSLKYLKYGCMFNLALFVLICQSFHATASVSSNEGNWEQFGYDRFHTRYQSTQGDGNISDYGTLWFKRFGDLDHDTIYGEPSVADINLDGEKEIIFGSDNGSLHCLNKEGEVNWEWNTAGRISSTPTLINLNHDNNLEIVIADGSGKVTVISSQGGLFWEYKTEGGVDGSPTVGDITGDGSLDIVVGSYDGYIYALTNKGDLIWKYDTGQGIGATAAVIIDINNDDQNDIIIGSGNGIMYAITNKNLFEPFDIINRTYYMPEVLWEFETPTPNDIGFVGSPVVVDINKDGKYEIIFGAEDGKLYCLDNNGKELWHYLTSTPVYTTPAVADINNDDDLEIVFDSGKLLIALDLNGNFLWQHEFSMRIGSNPTIFDLNGDGLLEITTIDEDHITVGPGMDVSPWINSTNILNYKGEIVKKFQFYHEYFDWIFGVSVVDLENDNKLEILTGTKNGFIYCYGELDEPENDHLPNGVNGDPSDGLDGESLNGDNTDNHYSYRFLISFGATVILLVVLISRIMMIRIKKRKKIKR